MRGASYLAESDNATSGPFYHGTKADLQPGDLIGPGCRSNYGRSLSGRITDVSGWREGWVAVIRSCVTEIGLSLEKRIWIAVDANHETLRFRVDADGPERSWQRNRQVMRGVLTDTEHGETWDFEAGS
jgi:hypothetical protein